MCTHEYQTTSQTTHKSNDKMRVVTEDYEAPYTWNFVHESTPIGVHSIDNLDVELFSNSTW